MFTFDCDERGYLKKRESFDLEYKENFHRGDELLKYIKTLVGMANNKGGQIVFGVKDSPHVPVGMTNDKFNEIDPKEIDNQIRLNFSQEISWSSNTFNRDNKIFGVLEVKESDIKPVICKRGKNGILREAAIYYRYRGESKEIEFSELYKMLEHEKEKERLLWINHIQKIAMIGPQNVELMDIYKGQLTIDEHKILIDENLLKKIKFIREGHFTDLKDEGSPTLRLIGDVKGVNLSELITADPNKLFPYTTKQLQEYLKINSFQMQAIIHVMRIKEKKKWHVSIAHGQQTIHKYTEELKRVLERKLKVTDFLESCMSQYKEYNKQNRLKNSLEKH